MARRPKIATEEVLLQAPLPKQTETYTVISHKSIIDNTTKYLTKYGFSISNRFYKCNDTASVAQGIYHLTYDKDPDMGMMFAWVNSYDKSVKFKCAVGAYVLLSNNRIIGNDACSWVRKHTGAADEEAEKTIDDQISKAEVFFKQIVHDKNEMKKVTITEKDKASLAGKMYFVNDILTTEQMTIIKEEMKNSSFNYGVGDDNLWAFYNILLHAFHKSHPKYWMDQQRICHLLITTDFKIPSLSMADAEALVTYEKTGQPIPPKPGDQLEITQDSAYKDRDEVVEEIVETDTASDAEADAIPESSSETSTEVDEETGSEIVIKASTETTGDAIEAENAEPVTEEVIEEEPMEEKAVLPEPETKEKESTEPETMPELVEEPLTLDLELETPEETTHSNEVNEAVMPESEPASFELAEDDSWQCLDCGETQGPEAIFYDGQLCGDCHAKINA